MFKYSVPIVLVQANDSSKPVPFVEHGPDLIARHISKNLVHAWRELLYGLALDVVGQTYQVNAFVIHTLGFIARGEDLSEAHLNVFVLDC